MISDKWSPYGTFPSEQPTDKIIMTGGADYLIAERDNIILKLLPESMIDTRRLTCEKYGEIDRYCLDGKPLVEFHPAKVEHKVKGFSHFYEFTQQYRVFTNV